MTTIKQAGIAIGALFLGFALAIYCYGYVAAEHPAYLWDWGNYFRFYQYLGELKSTNLEGWVRELALSIRSEDYNGSSVALLFPFYDALGPGRIGYILAIVFCFLLPATLVSAALSIHAARQAGFPRSDIVVIGITVATMLFTPYWQATLRGMPDVIGLIPLGIATLLVLRSDFLARNVVKTAILVGVMIWMAFLFRRWYAYACVALVACTFAMATMRCVSQKQGRSARFKEMATGFPIAGGVVAALLLIFQPDLLFRIFSTSYADLYVAYQAPIIDQLKGLYSYVGPFYVVAFVTGLGVAVSKRSTPVLFMAAVGSLTYFLFSRTQAPAVQHGLPLYFWGLPAAMFGIQWLLSLIPYRPRVVATFSFVALAAAMFLVATLPGPNAQLPLVATLAPHQTFFPLRVENYPEYQRLTARLQELTATGERFAVFASSDMLSDTLLSALDPSVGGKIAWSAQVDERDGFRLPAVRAKFAVVSDPIPLHLPESSQRVVTVPSEHISKATGFGSAYKKISGPYDLAGGHKAYIYERTRPLDDKDILELEAEFSKLHPGWKFDGISMIYLAPGS